MEPLSIALAGVILAGASYRVGCIVQSKRDAKSFALFMTAGMEEARPEVQTKPVDPKRGGGHYL